MSLERGWKPDPGKPFPAKSFNRRCYWDFVTHRVKYNPTIRAKRFAKKEHRRRSRLFNKRICQDELQLYKLG